MVPQPVLALLLLFPLTREAEQAKDAEEAAAGEQHVANTRMANSAPADVCSDCMSCDACRAAGIGKCSMQDDSMHANIAAGTQHRCTANMLVMCCMTFRKHAAWCADDMLVACTAAAGGRGPGPADMYFMRQTIGNACGTIGLLHALGNTKQTVRLGGRCTAYFTVYSTVNFVSWSSVCVSTTAAGVVMHVVAFLVLTPAGRESRAASHACAGACTWV